MLYSVTAFEMQPPDPALLIGNAMSDPSMAPAPEPRAPVVMAAQAGSIPKTALGIVLGVGIPLILGLGLSARIHFCPMELQVS